MSCILITWCMVYYAVWSVLSYIIFNPVNLDDSFNMQQVCPKHKTVNKVMQQLRGAFESHDTF